MSVGWMSWVDVVRPFERTLLDRTALTARPEVFSQDGETSLGVVGCSRDIKRRVSVASWKIPMLLTIHNNVLLAQAYHKTYSWSYRDYSLGKRNADSDDQKTAMSESMVVWNKHLDVRESVIFFCLVFLRLSFGTVYRMSPSCLAKSLYEVDGVATVVGDVERQPGQSL